jgi:O-antigen ligase
MPPFIAAILFTLGILTLFVQERKLSGRASWALWLPMMWLLISGSRHVSEWLNGTSTMSQEQYLEGSPLDAAVYALLLGAAIIVLISRHQVVAKVLRKNWPIILFVIYCAISILWSDFPGVALKRWIKSLGDYAMILILLTEHNREAAIKQVLSRVAIILMPLSILFVKYYPSLGRVYAEHWVGTQYFVGVSDNKNMLGMDCMIFGFAAYCQILEAWRGSRRNRNTALFVYGVVAISAIWLLILSNSMTSLSCFFVTSGLVAILSLVKAARSPVVFNTLVAIVVVSLFSVLFLGVGSEILQSLGRNSTLTGRTDIWPVLLSVPINPVVGTGFESFWLGSRLAYVWSFQIVNGITEAHNGYLEMYLNLGWIGVAFLAALLWSGYRNIQRMIGRDFDAGRLRVGYFVIAVVYNFTEAGFRSTDLVWIAFILAIAAPGMRIGKAVVKSKVEDAATVDYHPAFTA